MKFDIEAFFIKNWQHFAAIGFIFILAAIFYQPVMDGQRLKQHDIEQSKGMANEVVHYKETTGETALWTNSMFGGMPTTQIKTNHDGNLITQFYSWFNRSFPGPLGLLLMHLIGFYIFGMFLRMNPLVALFGGIAFSFASYEIIIVQAGHVSKAAATTWLAPIIGAMIYSYREKWVLGSLFVALFMTWELAVNHFQITYYLMFPMVAIGIYLFIDSIMNDKIKAFFISMTGVAAGIICAVLLNMGNVLMTNDYAKHTIRGANDLAVQPNGSPINQAESGGLEKDYLTKWSYGLDESFTLISPNVMGGSSFPIGQGSLAEVVEESTFTLSEQKRLNNLSPYWGEQPMVAGPIYLGIIVVFLAFLAMFFSKNMLKWPLFAVTFLALLLSWGKNFNGLTEWFIEYFPMYNKFRAPSMTLVLVELCVAMLAMLFLSELIKNRKGILEQKNLLIGTLVGFFVILVMVKFIGIGNYDTSGDQRQLTRIADSYRSQITSADADAMAKNYNLNIKDPAQVEVFVGEQIKPFEEDFVRMRTIREQIFHSSMNRTIGFAFLGIVLVLLFAFTTVSPLIIAGGFVLLVLMDLVPIADEYIGDEKNWVAAEERAFPIASNAGDLEIMNLEIQENPALKPIIAQALKDANKYLEEHPEIESTIAQNNVKDKYTFGALNLNSSYRVFDLDGGFNSSRSAYYHKSIGGYHGAKLRNIANLIDYHLGSMNEKAYDMLNTKYFIQTREEVTRAIPRNTALGNAWFVKNIRSYDTPLDEIRALGNTFEIEKDGKGTLLINGKSISKSKLFGTEKIVYLTEQGDSLKVELRAGLKEGEAVNFVSDANGNVNYVPAFVLEQDTLNSFESLVSYTILESFTPETEAVMLKSESRKLSAQSYTSKGTIKLDEYKPNKLTYTSNTEGEQFAVFSEIYYPDWKAYVDGKEVEIIKTNYLLRGISIPAGSHKVEFVYDQPIAHTAVTLSFIMSLFLIGSFALYIFFAIRNRRPEPTKELE
jgi:hypothetical protein|tara:strand:+ start:2568 stop:5552 length:2985 start_codon:yes stop_codon:yes gene_type:complete